MTDYVVVVRKYLFLFYYYFNIPKEMHILFLVYQSEKQQTVCLWIKWRHKILFIEPYYILGI